MFCAYYIYLIIIELLIMSVFIYLYIDLMDYLILIDEISRPKEGKMLKIQGRKLDESKK